MHFPSQAGNNHEEERGDVCNCEMLAELKGSTAKSEMTEGEVKTDWAAGRSGQGINIFGFRHFQIDV